MTIRKLAVMAIAIAVSVGFLVAQMSSWDCHFTWLNQTTTESGTTNEGEYICVAPDGYSAILCYIYTFDTSTSFTHRSTCTFLW